MQIIHLFAYTSRKQAEESILILLTGFKLKPLDSDGARLRRRKRARSVCSSFFLRVWHWFSACPNTILMALRILNQER